MRAILLSAFGPPDHLVPADVPEPVAGPGEVVVDVAYASVTFVETQVRAGRAPNPAMAPALPAILGNGVGGVVAATGAGADPGLVGRRVVTTTGGRGGYAERVAVPADGLVAVPAAVELDAATALLADGRTAIGLVRAGRIGERERVLVEAAAGGVGSLLVQLARAAGAEVVAAARGARKLAIARELGAAEVVDYAEPGWSDGVAPVDLVLDGVGGEVGREALGLVRSGGRFLRFGMASGAFTEVSADEAAARELELVPSPPPSPAEQRERTEAALAEAAAGRLRPLVGQVVPLERAAAAHAAIEARETIGKTLLRA